MWVTFRRVYHGWDIHRHGHARKKKKIWPSDLSKKITNRFSDLSSGLSKTCWMSSLPGTHRGKVLRFSCITIRKLVRDVSCDTSLRKWFITRVHTRRLLLYSLEIQFNSIREILKRFLFPKTKDFVSKSVICTIITICFTPWISGIFFHWPIRLKQSRKKP